ncbi:MAG TPA: exodeoxyribonuclease VII small subunit [Tenericutes bacterium]|jgi:exodeoxyribonuclease VII small subunit|nr:exodeoxyribonuclease VII small subunit [Mycoplasmatota bacterium]
MEEKTFEEALEELSEIVNELEQGETNLDEAVKKFNQGMELAKFCHEKLKNAEKQVSKVLSEDGKLEDFNIKEE